MLSRLHTPDSLQQRSGTYRSSATKFFSCQAATTASNARSSTAALQQQQQRPSTAAPSSFLQQQPRPSAAMFSTASPAAATEPQATAAAERSLICTSITASTVEAFLQEIQEATNTGVLACIGSSSSINTKLRPEAATAAAGAAAGTSSGWTLQGFGFACTMH